MIPKDIVFVVDASLSMVKQYNDFRPSKIEASLEIIGRVSRIRIIQYRDRIGLILFNAFVIPLLHPDSDYNKIVTTLSQAKFSGEGSALGDAIIEAVKMLRHVDHRGKLVVAISDGELNIGSPLELAALYANNSGVALCIIVIGRRKRYQIRDSLERLSGYKMLVWHEVDTVSEAESTLLQCLQG